MTNMITFDFLSQAIGIIASLFVICAYGVKSDVTTKRITMGGSILFALHFFLLGAISAMAVTIVNILRVWLSIRFHGSGLICWVFVSLYLLIGFATFEETIDILAILAPIIGCIAMYYFSGIQFRAVCIAATTCWLVYGLLIGSLGVVITQIVLTTVNLTTIYRIQKDLSK